MSAYHQTVIGRGGWLRSFRCHWRSLPIFNKLVVSHYVTEGLTGAGSVASWRTARSAA
jgi:hypothetical protein